MPGARRGDHAAPGWSWRGGACANGDKGTAEAAKCRVDDPGVTLLWSVRFHAALLKKSLGVT